MKIKVKLFDIYVFLIALLKGFGLDSGDPVYFIAFVVGCAAIVIKMMHEKYVLSELIALGSLLLFAGLNFVICGSTQVLFTAIAICGLKNVDIKRVITISFWVRITAYVLVVVVYLLGFAEENTVQFVRNGAYVTRHMFCYSHPNLAHFMFATIVVQGLYLYNGKMNILRYLILLLVNYGLYVLTYSRTGFYSVIIGTVLFALVRYNKLSALIKWGAKNSFIILFALTLVTGFLYDDLVILQKIDKVLTGRLYYNNIVLSNYTPNLFGLDFAKGIILDSGYLSLLFNGGILVFAWFLYFLYKLHNKLYQENRIMELTLILCFMIYCFTESLLTSVSVNVSLFLLADVVFKSKKGVRE